MKTSILLLAIGVVAVAGVAALFAATPPGPIPARLANGEVRIQATTAASTYQRIDTSPDLQTWTSLVTLLSPGTLTHTDSAAPFLPRRFYRVQPLVGTGHLTGDHFSTSAGDAVVHPVNHASFVVSWNGKMIYNDPVGASTLYASFPKADLILVSHGHSDHYSNATLAAVLATSGRIIAPQSVYDTMTAALKAATTILANGASTTVIAATVEAVPAYNSNHPVGVGNGYVLTLGGKRLYMSGDTGPTAEMRAFANIDVAFLSMNVPFTMNVAQAASQVRAFRPRVVFPYHFRNQDNTLADLSAFKQQVGTDLGIEVRTRIWY